MCHQLSITSSVQFGDIYRSTNNRACIVQRKEEDVVPGFPSSLGINMLQAPTVYIARITNAVEGWHHGLRCHFLCHHPTVWRYVRHPAWHSATERHISTSHNWHHSSTAKKYHALNDRVTRAVAAYGRTEVFRYLRSINSASVAFVDIYWSSLLNFVTVPVLICRH